MSRTTKFSPIARNRFLEISVAYFRAKALQFRQAMHSLTKLQMPSGRVEPLSRLTSRDWHPILKTYVHYEVDAARIGRLITSMLPSAHCNSLHLVGCA